MPIFYLCPNDNNPSGGIKQIYRHVEILAQGGHEAYVLHSLPRFQITWFASNAPVAHLQEPLPARAKRFFKSFLKRYKYSLNFDLTHNILLPSGASITLGPNDVIVVPEFMVLEMAPQTKSRPHIVFNQSGHLLFRDSFDCYLPLEQAYKAPGCRGSIAVSEHVTNYLQFALPSSNIFRVINGVNTALFREDLPKKKQIAYMPRRLKFDLVQVLGLLHMRGSLKDWTLAPIENCSEEQVAKILGESMIYLSSSYQEGFALPPLEAAASGCTIIGYDGIGGQEYFNAQQAYPIEQSNPLEFARKLEELLRRYDTTPAAMRQQALGLSSAVRKKYSKEEERNSVLNAWKTILAAR